MNTRANGNGSGGTPRLASEPWSLDDAIAAAVAESEDAPFTFTYAGKTYELPPIKRLPIKVQDSLAQGRTDVALIAMLGEEEYDELTEHMTIGDLEVLFNQWAKVNGVESQGNSSRSQRRASSRT